MAAEKYLNDIKIVTEKINKKQKEIEDLKDKKEKSEAKLISALMQDNNLSIDDVVELFQGSSTEDEYTATKKEATK